MSSTVPDNNNITFITNRICPFAHRVWLVLEELRIPYELKETSISPGTKPAWFTETYRAALGADPASDGKVPILKDNDFLLTESQVVCEYLVEKYQNTTIPASTSTTTLFPSTPRERAEYLLFLSQSIDAFTKAFYPLLRSANEEDVEKYTQELLFVCQKLSTLYHSHEGPYLFGSRLTLADILLWPFLQRLCVVEYYRGFTIPSTPEYTSLHTFINTMKTRTSVERTTMPPEYFIDGYKMYAGSFLPKRVTDKSTEN